MQSVAKKNTSPYGHPSKKGEIKQNIIYYELKNQDIKNYATLLLQLEIKKEVLVFEEKLLRKKL